MEIRCKKRDFPAFYSTSRESLNYFPVLLVQGRFGLWKQVITHIRWKVKWRLERLGALGTMGETAPLRYIPMEEDTM